MEQIKAYLSKFSQMGRVLLLSSSFEFLELEDWLSETGKVGEVIGLDLRNKEAIAKARGWNPDVVIFDYGYSKKLIESKIATPACLIGRLGKDEDYFSLWEAYRNLVQEIYLERDRGIDSERISLDRMKYEILHWERPKDQVELSVIIPVYNVEEYLPACIESLIEWKADYVEYLFVDDGSQDKSAELIRDYGGWDQRIRLICKENGGCASARNRGIKEARGRYLGFVDSDDFIDGAMFQKLFSRALMGGYDIAYCGYSEFNEETKAVREVKNDCLKDPYVEGTWRQDKVQLLALKTRVAIWRCVYKKELLEKKKIGFREELKRFDDLPFRVEVLFTARSAVCVPEHLYYYRLGRGGQDVSCKDKRLFVHFDIFDGLDKFVEDLEDQRLKDILQVVKIHTHGFGLSRIEKKYKKEYIRLARQQLDRNMGYVRTICLILMYTGKGNLGWYTRMKMGRLGR